MGTQTNIRTRKDSLAEWTIIIAAGIFATGLSQPEVLDLPFRHLLTSKLLVGLDDNDKAQKMALFFTVASLPWSLKILAGLLLDSVPFFGTWRRNYLLTGAICASALWLLLGGLRESFALMAFICMAINSLLVITSSAGGALFAEVGQRLGAIDRFTVVRVFCDSTNSLIAGPLSGWLAILPFTTFTLVGAIVPLILVPVVVILLREPIAKFDATVFQEARQAVKTVVSSRQAWGAAAFLCIVSAPQSFQSLLYIHQTKILGMDDQTIGWLNSIAGVGGILATIIYSGLRNRLILRTWLLIGILCSSFDAYFYTHYRSLEIAYVIHLAHGLLITLSVLAMLEVVGRATPGEATALGFAFMASAWNSGIPIGDYLATTIAKYGFSFYQVVAIYAVLALLTITALRLLPRAILLSKGGPDERSERR